MKAAVMNYTGTVGKTTIAVHMLSPRMNGAPIYAIESINESAEGLGLDVEKMRGNKFRELLKKIVMEDNAIIDIGASNVEDFMVNLEGFEEAHEEIDFYIIPVTSGTKEQKETVAMVKSLAAIGVPPEKIRIIFNRVERDVVSEFSIIVNYHKLAQNFTLNIECAVYETELFDALSLKGLSLKSLMADETDYKELLKDKDADPKERARWSDMYGLKLLCKGVNRKLDSAYNVLFS